jgi:hypothetical protein
MSTGKALVVAVLLVLPGAIWRVAPYVERIVTPPARRAASATPATPPRTSAFDFTSTASRLSQRPPALVAAGFALEMGIYVVTITILLRSRRLVSLLAATSRGQQALRSLFFVALVAGFLAGAPESFPFVAWRMYSGIPESPPSAYLVTGVTRSGVPVRLDLGRVLPMLGPYRGYNVVAERAAALESSELKYDSSELTTALRAVAGLYNLQSPADPLAQVSVSAVIIPLDNRQPPWRRDERVVATTEVD